jgi:hypothetical protein
MISVVNIQNKFSFGPSQEDEGQKKTVMRMDGTYLDNLAFVQFTLNQDTWRAIRKSPALRAFHRRVMSGQKNRKNIATVAVARKLLSIMRSMLSSGEFFNEELVCQACGFEKIGKKLG